MKGMRFIGNLVILMMVMVIAISCESNYRELLKKEITASNRQCPMHFGDAATLNSMKYDDTKNTVQFYYSIADYNFEVFKQSPDVMKNQIMLSLKSDDTKELLNLMDKANSSLELIFKQMNGSEEITLTVTADELRGISNGSMNTAGDSRKRLENIIQMENTVCPYELEKGMTMNRVYLEGDKAVYECSVDEDLYDISLLRQMKGDVKEGIEEVFKGDPTMQNAAEVFAENNIDVIYRYVGSSSGESCEIVFTPADFRSMTKKSLNALPG